MTTYAMPSESRFAALTQRTQAVMNGVQRFTQSGDPEDLSTVARELLVTLNYDDLMTLTPDELRDLRRQYVSDYAKLFAASSTLHDPRFHEGDPKSMPLLCVMPPAEPDRRLFSCADPAGIRDPATRTRYIAEIAANHERTRWANFQIRLARSDGAILTNLRLTLRWFHGHAPEDSAELSDILQSAGLTNAMMADARAEF